MIFVLVLLTALDGTPVWVESTAVTIVRPSQEACKFGNGAAIRVGATALCVRETPAQIRELVRGAK